MTIFIKWKSTENPYIWTEYLDIDMDHLDAESIEKLEETKQCWPEKKGEFFRWRVKCKLKKNDNGDHEIAVKYLKDQQDDGNDRTYIKKYGTKGCFGENRIIVTQDSETGQAATEGDCKWTCDDPDLSGRLQWRAMGRPRLRVTREQWQRESRFRKAVLAKDGRCVITEEETPGVLDAAHLRPVNEGGEELVENGFILRTDIHRLYDRGMFFISPEDGTITITDRSLSKYYRQLLCDSRLPQATLKRVRSALQEQWENPWS